MKKTEAINYILDNFDFEKVHKAMTALDWTWRNDGVPAVSDLRQKARQLLSEIHIDNSGKGYYASGGFEVTALDGMLKLDFVLESWDEEIAEVYSKTKQIQKDRPMKTIAQELNIKDFPFEIKNKDGNVIYWEDSRGYWSKWEYDSEGRVIYYEDSNKSWSKWEYDSDNNQIYSEDSTGHWYRQEYDSDGRKTSYQDSNDYLWKSEYDSQGNEIYYEDFSGYWCKREFDSDGRVIYYEDSYGVIDNRPKEDVITLNGIKYKRMEQ